LPVPFRLEQVQVPPCEGTGNTYRLADALIKANKRFDMFVLPGLRHSFQPAAGYANWLRGDYFARHLLGSASVEVDIVELNREKEQTGEKKKGS